MAHPILRFRRAELQPAPRPVAILETSGAARYTTARVLCAPYRSQACAMSGADRGKPIGAEPRRLDQKRTPRVSVSTGWWWLVPKLRSGHPSRRRRKDGDEHRYRCGQLGAQLRVLECRLNRERFRCAPLTAGRVVRDGVRPGVCSRRRTVSMAVAWRGVVVRIDGHIVRVDVRMTLRGRRT